MWVMSKRCGVGDHSQRPFDLHSPQVRRAGGSFVALMACRIITGVFPPVCIVRRPSEAV